tara:strand:+ start:419 stop:694 length:276 start_codon:yes stop_codon:yes gene_type:complete
MTIKGSSQQQAMMKALAKALGKKNKLPKGFSMADILPKKKKKKKTSTIMTAKKGGVAKKKKFPDLSGDGKVTKKDILMGRGIIKKKKKDKK